MADLRGRFVLLDFWTFCCVNCLHVIDELRPLERSWGDELVVIGVRSPKFVHEADPAALAAAVQRYELASGPLAVQPAPEHVATGLLDGPAGNALLQHPLGVTALPDGTLAVHDTYNGAVRLLSRSRDSLDGGWDVSTLTTGLAEPSGGILLAQELVVVESAAHHLTRVDW